MDFNNNAEAIFDKYTAPYDRNNGKIQLKIIHTKEVAKVMNQLTQALDLDEHMKELGFITAIFHDIGRFEQITRYNTYNDRDSVDHADFGCEIIRRENLLSFLSEDDQLKVLTAIRNHNKLTIEDGLEQDTLLLCQLIRDSDKSDIFRVFANEDLVDTMGETLEEVESETVSSKVYKAFMNYECIDKNIRKTGLDKWVGFLGFFFDIYFDETIEIIMKEKYYRKQFDQAHFNPKTQKKVDEILEELEIWIADRRAENLRRKLHQCPELALNEKKTKELLLGYLRQEPSLVVEDRENWFYVYKAGITGSLPIAFRADFDAVPSADGIPGHFCGHDGHSAILACFARMLTSFQIERDVYFIFQPAEETGQGALLCKDLLYEKHIAEIYAFHNIPGYQTGQILLRKGTFACASTGLEVTYKGKMAHAAYPEAGINPANAIAMLLSYINERSRSSTKGMTLATLIGVDAGSKAYGLSASKATLRFTLRGEYQVEFERLLSDICQRAERIAKTEKLQYKQNLVESFPATENNLKSVKTLKKVAADANLSAKFLSGPFRWSEDFGYYLQNTAGAMFGVGSGIDHPALHTREYEFPDEIIPYVLKMFLYLAKYQPLN